MPALRVYKHGNTMIPVDGTKIAKAYQCPWTDQLFDNKRSYVAHLARLRKNRMHKNAQLRQRDKIFNEFINQPSFEALINWIETNPWFFFDNIAKSAYWQTKKGIGEAREKFTIKIRKLDLHWQDSVSNSHSCPRGGVENWHRHDNKPTGYPGWRGRIEFSMGRIGNSYYGSDLFKGTGINTGTGGGNGVDYGYEVKLFASDFPQLEKMATEKRDEYMQARVLAALTDDWRHQPFDLPFKYQADKNNDK